MAISVCDKPILELCGITKSFGDNTVIRDLSMKVEKGEFLTVLGSSGCGKTTLLRIICGLEEADRGQVIIEGSDVSSLDPNRRDVNTVFQSYALFPHMNVYDNIAFPLRMKHVPPREIKERVGSALELVRMSGYEKRYPFSLSGGQRQRIAIARSVVGEPKILLLDEPLGALDMNLRHRMQEELKGIQKRLGITFIYITHDQEEALNMSDRIAVMKDGKFLQVGTPDEIYDSPETVYAAKFIGGANILPCTFAELTENGAVVEFASKKLLVRAGKEPHFPGDRVYVALRGEKISFLPKSSEDELTGIITSSAFIGGVMRISADVGGTLVTSIRYGLDPSASREREVSVKIEDLSGIIVSPEGEAGGGVNE